MKTNAKIVVTIVYGEPKKLLAESRTMLLSLRGFVALPKIVQVDYQPRSPQDKTAQITVKDFHCTEGTFLELHPLV